MELASEFIDRHIEKIKSDASLSEATKERRIEIYEAMRPEKNEEANVKADIEKWSRGELTSSGKVSESPKLRSENPKEDIEKWSKSKQ